MIGNKVVRRDRRKKRIRKRAYGTSEKPRLTVYKGGRNIQAQLIDDDKGVTLASASSFDKNLRAKLGKGWTVKAAEQIGTEIARKALEINIKKVVFDRNGFSYHQKLKVLADAARKEGLLF